MNAPNLYCICGDMIQDGLGQIHNGPLACNRCFAQRCKKCIWAHIRKCNPIEYLEIRNMFIRSEAKDHLEMISK